MDAIHPILEPKAPLLFRWSQSLERRGGYALHRRMLAHWSRERNIADWEWRLKKVSNVFVMDALFVAHRIPTSLKVRVRPIPRERFIRVSSWDGNTWRDEDIDRDWNFDGQFLEFHVKLNRLILTKKLRIEVHADEDSSVGVTPYVMKAPYRDVTLLSAGRQALRSDDAWGHLIRCLELEPKHYPASIYLAELAMELKRWPEAVRYAMHAHAHSWGDFAGPLLWNACKNKRDDLNALIPSLRDEAKDWDVSGHFGTTCLLNEKTYSFGFGRFHLLEARQIIVLRRQAAARMLPHLHFDYTSGKEKIAFAGLRVWRGPDDIVDVPTEHLAVVDHEDDNPAIRFEGQKRALYHLPELHRGDCIELVYYLVGINSERPEDLPDFFVLSDLSSDFPTWKSQWALVTPEDWDLRCLTTNGGPAPVHERIGDGLQRHQVKMEKIFHDSWGVSEIERRYRSPHLCASWNDRSWSEIAAHSAAHFCHALRDDNLPEPIRQAIEMEDSVEGKLRVGFDWIRDNLKYMSLESNKNLTNDPDLANKIVAIGVGDCMDRAYLVSILCRSLGIESEYVVTASASGYTVPEIPAQQFDHILVRAHLDGRRYYLDATRSDTPFGWIPPNLQGVHILPLKDDAELETVEEEPPEANQIAISEELLCEPTGRVAGTFEMMALGMPARWWDGQWKGLSMDVENPTRVARLALRRQLPSVDLIDWDVQPYQSGREKFVLQGHHTRANLYPIGQQLVGFIDYKTELFQLYRVKDRTWNGVNIFPLPLRYWFSLAITSPDGYSIEGTSEPIRFTSAFGDVLAAFTRKNATLDIECTMTVKKRFVQVEDPGQVAEFLSAWERALSFAYVLTPSAR